MKQIDISSAPKAGDNLFGKLQSQLQQAFKSGTSRAQDTLAQLLSKRLDNHYVFLRNLALPAKDPKAESIVIPCVLVGPACLIVFNPTDVDGFFRVKEDAWLEMEKNSQNYRPAARNLIYETLSMAGHLDEFMQAGGQPYPEIQEVLFFGETGARIESIRPAVRILQLDAVDRYIGGLLQEAPLLDARQVDNLVDWLTSGASAGEETEPEPAPEPKEMITSKTPEAIKGIDGIIRKAGLTRQQWIILGVMLGVQILLLFCLIMVIVLTS